MRTILLSFFLLLTCLISSQDYLDLRNCYPVEKILIICTNTTDTTAETHIQYNSIYKPSRIDYYYGGYHNNILELTYNKNHQCDSEFFYVLYDTIPDLQQITVHKYDSLGQFVKDIGHVVVNGEISPSSDIECCDRDNIRTNLDLCEDSIIVYHQSIAKPKRIIYFTTEGDTCGISYYKYQDSKIASEIDLNAYGDTLQIVKYNYKDGELILKTEIIPPHGDPIYYRRKSEYHFYKGQLTKIINDVWNTDPCFSLCCGKATTKYIYLTDKKIH